MFPDISQIKKRRQALGITQTQLAVRSQVSQSMIAKIESRAIEPSYSVVGRIFESLGELENSSKVKAKDIMRRKLISVGKEDVVGQAISIMRRQNISQVSVEYDGRQEGSISEKTIVEAMLSGKANVEEMKVFEIMDDPFPTVNEETPIDVLMSILKHNPAVLIVNKGIVSGIVTKSDLLGALGH